MSTTFWELFKRRVLPIAFICGMAVLIQRTCNGATRTHATIVIDLGDAAAVVKKVDAQLVVAGDSNAQFHRTALPDLSIGPCQFEVAMPADDGELTIDVLLPTTSKHFVRKIHASEGAVVRVTLGPELTE
ncbi:MAG: hypothetical protein ABI175_09190 [Polyangiales bacterium]